MNNLFFLRCLWLLALTFGLLTRLDAEPAKPSPSPAPTASVSASRLTYDSFRLVHTRNVFDPDRRPVRPVAAASTPAPTRADYAVLTGTLLSAEKSSAFFSGSRPEFNKVLGVQGKIANATIRGITSANIEIERDGKRTTVAVGQTVPFDNQTAPGAPPVEAPPAAASSADGAASAAAATSVTTTTTAAPAYSRPVTTSTPFTPSNGPKGPPPNIDEIRRRMMEKRQQELK